MKLHRLTVFTVAMGLGACSGVFDSSLPSTQAYVLRLPPAAAPSAPAPPAVAGTVQAQRPEAGPGLDSDRIALLRSDQRFDSYSASRWAAPAPDLLENLMVDALRATGAFSAVFDDHAPFAPRYNLRCALRRFEADYTKSSPAPTIFVNLECTLARHRDRELLASFTAEGSAVAREDRLNAVVAAFESATATAMAELGSAASQAIAAEKRPSESR